MKEFIKEKIRSGLLKEEKIPFNMPIPKDILLINDVFKKHGFKSYLVGGAVRDALLGKTPKDFDIATNALPDKVIEILKPQSFVKNILETGKSFGVINVITDSDEYEIATLREDLTTGRNPEVKLGATIESDSKRRDLTINALYYDIDTKEIIDLVGGVNDIKNGIVRTVGRPEDRFGEDRLRIIRSIRFAARFGSELDPAVDKALRTDASLEGVSSERIRDEFLKGIKSVKQFLLMIDKYNLFDWIFKGLDVNKSFIEERDPYVLIAYLLINNPISKIQSGLNKLTYSTEEIRIICFLASIKQLTPEHSFGLKKAQTLSGANDEQIRKIGSLFNINSKLIDTFIKFKLSVSGQDVMNSGIKPGPDLGKEIQRLEIEKFKDLLN